MTPPIARELELGRALQALLDLGCLSVEIVPGTLAEDGDGEPADVAQPYAVVAVTSCGCRMAPQSGGAPADMLKCARVEVEAHLRGCEAGGQA